jgi:hypothetical protein
MASVGFAMFASPALASVFSLDWIDFFGSDLTVVEAAA